MKKYLIIALMLCNGGLIMGQSIVRSVICSFGKTQTNTNNETLISTFGQCPGCSTLNGTDGSFLIQGFNSPSGGGIDADCEGLADFGFEEIETPCGTSFSFFYEGFGDINTSTFSWNFGANAFPQTSSDPNPTDVIFNTLGMQNITLTVVFEHCDVSKSNTLNAENSGFGVNANINSVSCVGESDGNIQLEVTNGTPPYTITWATGETTQTLSNLEMGDYAYTVADAEGCQVENSVAVPEPFNPLTIDLIVTKVSCGNANDGSIVSVASGGTTPYTYEWSNNSTENSIQDISTGNYSVTVTDMNGCSLSAVDLVGEACRPIIYNTISPNGDNMNDVWIIEDISDFPDNEMKIYNRWGSLIYEEVGYNNDWGGTDNNGKPLLAGAYYYVLNLNNVEQTVLTGSLTLVR